MALTWRAVVIRERTEDGRVIDPETYWGDLEETMTLLDAVMAHADSQLSAWPVRQIVLTPFSEALAEVRRHIQERTGF